ncbi:unnamed protein product [Blepharisma stoltei]|uniref:Peptidase A1 domain-containing protein n=1 Tax=Blepharisma stoltei TaxID=1481888 RepID=A0AAU9K3E3_9CILI|nr:unnamed protein product [Blepharisma stoltei]
MLRYLLLLIIPVISKIKLGLHSDTKKTGSSRILEIPLKNSNNEAYSIALSIGTPPQHFELLLSTGNSSLSWIVSSTCFNCRMPVNAYDINKSTSYTSQGILGTLDNGYSTFTTLLSTDNFKFEDSSESVQYFWLFTQNLNYPGQIIEGVLDLGLNNLGYPLLLRNCIMIEL